MRSTYCVTERDLLEKIAVKTDCDRHLGITRDRDSRQFLYACGTPQTQSVSVVEDDDLHIRAVGNGVNLRDRK
ncbi:MAG: hypothetical protein AAGE96_13735 [Cyanobacteria bacterium P01_G01_bin.19]